MFGKKKQDNSIETQAKITVFNKKASRFLTEAEEKKQKLLDQAKKAKSAGNNVGFKIACTGLAALLSLKNRVEKMVSVMDTLSIVKDVSDMTGSFLGGMEETMKDIAGLSKGINFKKYGKMFDSTMQGVSGMFEGLDSMVEDMSLGFESMDSTIDPSLEKQISDMLDIEEISKTDDELDSIIEKQLKKLKNETR